VTATGKLLRLGAAEFDVEDMIGRPDVLDQTNSAATVVNDYVWGTPTPPPAVIPYPSITINLNSGALGQVDVWRVLGVRIGDRISIPDAPATWPAGSSTLFVEGVTRVESAAQRTVTWNTSPVIGAAPGQVGPWFRLNSSLLGGSDLVPF
jgi:hypothetical protein